MAWRIVKQPNGLLARFSDIVDNYTHINMTQEEAIALCVDTQDMGKESAIKKVQAGIEDHKPWTLNVIGSGHDRWDDCNEAIIRVHGQKEMDKILTEIEHSLTNGVTDTSCG